MLFYNKDRRMFEVVVSPNGLPKVWWQFNETKSLLVRRTGVKLRVKTQGHEAALRLLMVLVCLYILIINS